MRCASTRRHQADTTHGAHLNPGLVQEEIREYSCKGHGTHSRSTRSVPCFRMVEPARADGEVWNNVLREPPYRKSCSNAGRVPRTPETRSRGGNGHLLSFVRLIRHCECVSGRGCFKDPGTMDESRYQPSSCKFFVDQISRA